MFFVEGTFRPTYLLLFAHLTLRLGELKQTPSHPCEKNYSFNNPSLLQGQILHFNTVLSKIESRKKMSNMREKLTGFETSRTLGSWNNLLKAPTFSPVESY